MQKEVSVHEEKRKRERVEDGISKKHTDYISLCRLTGNKNYLLHSFLKFEMFSFSLEKWKSQVSANFQNKHYKLYLYGRCNFLL